MPRRNKPTVSKPPDSKSGKSKVSSFLGDSSNNEDLSDAESFQSAEPEPEQTDYGFDYTTSGDPGDRSARRTHEENNQTTGSSNTSNENPDNSRRTTRHSERRSASLRENTPHRSRSSNNPKQPELFLPERSAPAPSKQKKKQRKQNNPLRRSVRMWKEIRDLQKRTDNLTPKAPFGRLIRELLMEYSTSVQRITAKALEALQVSAEMYLTHLFEDAYMLTLHRGRVTLSALDVRLVRYLRGPNDNGR